MHTHHARAHAERSGCCEVTVWRLGDYDRETDGCCGGCCCCCGCCCHGHHRHHGERSWCHEGGHGFRRRFVSRAERIAQLEAYLAELQAEAQAVQEEISRLRKSD